MIEITGPEQVAAWRDHVLPPVERLRPGLWSIPVPLPNVVLRYVLVYLLELPDGVAIIDTGWDTAQAWAALTDGIALTGHDVADIKAILVTHSHPDHYGLAARARAASGAWIGMHEAEAATLMRRRDQSASAVEGRSWLLRNGVPQAELDALAGSPGSSAHLLAMPEPDRFLGDNDKIDLPGWDLRAQWTPGHTPGHLCFFEQQARVLFTGDHILPRISPNISLMYTAGSVNPLRLYLDSLLATSEVAADEVLPAHEYRFRGLSERTRQLQLHHAERLGELHGLLRRGPGQTAWQLATRLSWSRPWTEIRGNMRWSALGETLAHLVLLESDKRAVRSPGRPERWRDADGHGG